jgi:thiol-disulfide isomerase/thioredoxin
MKPRLKSRLKIFFSVVFISIIGSLSVLSYFKISEKQNAENKIEWLPEFELTDIHSNYPINLDNIISGRPTLLVFFHSHCDYCTHELTALNDVRDRLIESNVVFFSPEHPDTLRQFMTEFNFDECENIFVGRANQRELFDWFGEMVPPTSFVYDENLQLVEKYKGLRNIEVILEALEKGRKLNQ